MLDNNLFLRTSGAGSLTATETATALAINGTPQTGLACRVIIPKQSIGDTMQVTLQHSTDNSTFTNLLTFETLSSVTAAITDSVELTRRFATQLKYVRTVTTVAGTSPDFGAVVIAIGDQDAWNQIPVGLPTNPIAGTLN